jgi:hypothetical protein
MCLFYVNGCLCVDGEEGAQERITAHVIVWPDVPSLELVKLRPARLVSHDQIGNSLFDLPPGALADELLPALEYVWNEAESNC